MHRPQFFTWTTHTAENTTLLEATRLQKLYTYMCNIVTEFYLYSIVYIYLINSRLDVTHSVRHHFRTIQTLSWCQKVVRISRNGKSYSDRIHNNNNNDNRSDTLSWCQTSGKSREEFTVIELTHTQDFKRLFERTLNIQTSSKTICYDHSILEMQGESFIHLWTRIGT